MGYRFYCLRYFNVIGCGDFEDAYENGEDNIVPPFVKAVISRCLCAVEIGIPTRWHVSMRLR